MQCDDVEIEVARPSLNQFDTALNGLGVLPGRTTSGDEYLQEDIDKKYLNMLTINTSYVRNVSIGFRVTPVRAHARYKPYLHPKERYRTRSENNDNNEAATVVKSVVDEVDCAIEELMQMKKAKSLESIVAENGQKANLENIAGVGNQSELEVVSDCIQNLKVDE